MSPAKLLDRDRTLLAESNAIMASAEALYRFRENVVSIELRDTARSRWTVKGSGDGRWTWDRPQNPRLHADGLIGQQQAAVPGY